MDNQVVSSSGYYTHSGKFTLRGVVFSLVVGCAAAAGLAVVYGFLVQYNPFVYFNAIGCFFFAAIMGTIAGKFLHSGDVRNNTVALAIGLAVGTAGLYVSWAVWVYALAHRSEPPLDVGIVTLLVNPPALWTLIGIINKTGAWTMAGSTVSGVVLWIIWLIEAVVILGVTAAMANSGINEQPFCERCERWCETSKNVVRTKFAGSDEVKQQLTNHNFQFLEQLGAADRNAAQWLRIDLDSCGRCHMTNALTAKSVRIEVKKGKASEKSTDVMSKLLISQGEHDDLRRLGTRLRPTSAAT